MIAVRSVTYGDSDYPLQLLQLGEIEMKAYKYRRESPGTPSVAYLDQAQRIGLWPPPDECEWVEVEGAIVPSTVEDTIYSTPSAPSVATGDSGVLTGTYTYKVTLVSPNGETLPSAASNSVSPTAKKVVVSSIDTGLADSLVIARNIYRIKNGGTTYYFVGTVSGNDPADTFVDNIPDSELFEEAPTSSTASGIVSLLENDEDSPAFQEAWHRTLVDVAVYRLATGYEADIENAAIRAQAALQAAIEAIPELKSYYVSGVSRGASQPVQARPVLPQQ
jgi:hypothetical protein